MDPNHDADIRIGSEAPKQRRPFLIFGMKAMGAGEQPLPRIVFGRSSLMKRRRAKTDDLLFLLLTSASIELFR